MSSLIAKTLRSLGRYWEENKIFHRPLEEEDISFILKSLLIFLLKNKPSNLVRKYCKSYFKLHQCIENASFSCLEECDEAKLYTLSEKCNLMWLNNGLAYAFNKSSFCLAFFDDLAEIVADYSESVETPFSCVEIPTDTSITCALAELPNGYPEILLRLQYNIAKETVLPLIISVLESGAGFGGPGTSLRLIVDMVESQLFNSSAIMSGLAFTLLNETKTIAAVLYEILLDQIGPFPSNMAFGPIFRGLFHLEYLRNENYLFSSFLQYCNENLRGKAAYIKSMGLLTVLGLFILAEDSSTPVVRAGNMLCRSQIVETKGVPIVSLDSITKIMTLLCELDISDDFVMIAISNASYLIKMHGTTIITEDSIKKILKILVDDPDTYVDVLDKETYDKLKSVCEELVKL